MAVDDYIEDRRQDVLKARAKADALLDVACRAERAWRDAESDYATTHSIYGKALEAREQERQR